MSKISTYPSADVPLQLSDRLIGTEAIRPVPSPTPLATKNFSLGELLQLFSSNFPAATLQAVLNAGNIATQNITLTGTITATLIKPINIEDTSGSQGLPFQVLSKGAVSITWVDIPNISGYVPISRELTINGITYDLSADRSWTVSAGGATWGSITGTITLQIDLIDYLNLNYYPLLANPAGYLTQQSVLDYPDFASFPPIGALNTIYIALDTDIGYYWDGVSYQVVTSSVSGIAGFGTINTVPKFSPTGSELRNSRFTDDGAVGRYGDASNYVEFITGSNTFLKLYRVQSKMQFILGNPLVPQENVIYSDNTYGTALETKGYLAFRVGAAATTEGLRILSTGQVQLPQTPATGTTSDFVLLRDVSGNVKQIAYPIVSAVWGSITGTLSAQTDLQTSLNAKVDENTAITGATKTKITYDAKGLVTAGADATTADIADSANKRYQTDAQQTNNDATSSIQTQLNSKLNDILLSDITINMPINGAAGVNNVVGNSLTFGNGPSPRTITDANLFTRTTRLALETTAIAGTASNIRQLTAYFTINTGFKLAFKMGASTGATNTNVRFSIGVFTANFGPGNVDPTTLINCAAFARIDGNTNWQFIHNDNTGTATAIDLGSSFPANTVSTDMYYGVIETVGANIKYTLTRLNTGATTTGTASTNLVAASTLLAMSAGCSNNTNAAVCALDFGGMQLIKFT